MATQFENLPTSVKKIVDKLVNDKKTKIPGIAKDNEKLKEINKLKRQVAREFIEQANEMKTPREKAVRNVKRVKETKPVIKKVEVEEIVIPRIHKDNEWDFAIGDEVPFFDISLSYELTGYRPINLTEGLDFDPELYIQSRRNYQKTGHYTQAPKGTKAYDDFWTEEYRRLNEGLEVKGYRITGDHYFFLNYYLIMNTDEIRYAGQGRYMGFASFYVGQYEYFHYIELCKRLFKNSIALKGRGLGWSEIAACIIANTYIRTPNTRSLVVAHLDFYLDKTLTKVWTQFNFCNDKTDGGLLKPLLVDLPRKKKTGVEESRTRVEKGWLSEVEGIVADRPSKVRGDRAEILFFEESGSFPKLIQSWVTGSALVQVNGIKLGILCGFGTGGDVGKNLEGLKTIFNDPEYYDVLPMRHNYTRNGETTLTGYFIPSYRIVTKDIDTGRKLMDSRGYTDPDKGREYYNRQRLKLAKDPHGYLMYCAEYCFVPEDALVMEGENQFNRILLVDQLAQIKLFNKTPHIWRGLIEYNFDGNSHTDENIKGFKLLESKRSNLQIIEHPIRDEGNLPFKNLYVAGIDSIDMGKSETSEATRDPSEFCMTIYRRPFGTRPPMFVAMYKDRPNDVREAYKIALRLCEYYNCQALLENSKISLRMYFQERNKAHKYLMRRPRATLTDSMGGNSKLFGAPATESVIHHQLDLIAQYIEDYSQEMWFEEMIDDCINYSYDNKTKFDIVASMGMALLADEELQGFVPKPADSTMQWRDFGWYTDPDTGYKRYGELPQPIQVRATLHSLHTDGVNYTSDSRYVYKR